MATEAQIQANRQNAQKSSGPKTEEGKNNSRQNSLKHGLTGQAIVQPEGTEAELLQLRVQQWTDHLNPQSPTEEWLITSAAIASARIDRCIRHETATLDHRLRHLPATRQKQRAETLEALLKELSSNPEKAQPALLESASGTRYLLDRWQSLRTSLTQNPPRTAAPEPLLQEMTQLLGHRRFSFWQGRELENLARIVLAVLPDNRLTPALICDTLAIKLPADNPNPTNPRADFNLPPRETAQTKLLAFIDAQIKTLETHLGPVEAREAQDDAEAADLALVDNSPEAARLHRYEAALYRQLNQCLSRLEKLRSGNCPSATTSHATRYEQAPPPPPLDRQAPAPPAQNHNPSSPPRQNEANFFPPKPDRTHGDFLNFTVGRPSNRKNLPPSRRA